MKQGGGTWRGGERGKRIRWREGLGTGLRRRGELAAARARACGCGGVEQGRRGGVRGWHKVLGCGLDCGGTVAWAWESCGDDDGSSRD